MKNTIKLFGIIALVAVIGIIMVACPPDEKDKGTPYTIYKGQSSNGYSYELKIMGANYSLSGYIYSDGTVIQKLDTTYYLKPSDSAVQFTATVSSAGLVELIGTIYQNGNTVTLPGSLTPMGIETGIDSGGGNVPGPPVGPGGGTPSGEEEW